MIKNEFEIANVFKPVNTESLFDLGSLKDEKLVVEKII